MTHYKQLMDTNYLGAYSLDEGKDIVLTIKAVQKESVIGADGKKEDCIVCHWAENEKPMILNATNCRTISKLAGSPYIEKWTGLRVQIGSERVKAFGDVVDALRIRKTKPSATQTETVKCEECGNDIVGSNGMDSGTVARYTKMKYGRTLCAECAKKERDRKDDTQ